MTVPNKRILLPILTNLSTDYRCYKIVRTLKDSGYEPVVVCDRPLIPIGPQWDDIDVRMVTGKSHLNGFKSVFIIFIIKLIPYLLSTKYRICIVEDCPGLLISALIGKLTRKTVIYDSHELFLEVPTVKKSGFNRAFWKFWHNTGIGLIDKIIMVSPDYIDFLKNTFPDKEYFLLPNVPADKPVEIRNRTVPTDRVKLIFQGYICEETNLVRVLETVKKDLRYHLTVAGDGPELGNVKQQTSSLGISDRVEFVGMVPFEELCAYTSAAHIGISAVKPLSLSQELTWPNKIFEYMHEGIPVLMSMTAGNESIVAMANIGALADADSPESMYEGLKSILERYEELSQNCLKASEKFRWENYEGPLLDFISPDN